MTRADISNLVRTTEQCKTTWMAVAPNFQKLFTSPVSIKATMANETNRLKAKLATLDESLDDIEALLEPLLAQTLPETVVDLETVQQAKLQVVLPYLVYDLIFSA